MWEIMNSTDLKCQRPNMLAMDGLNNVMLPKLLTGASEAEIRGANIALKNALNGEVQPGNGEAINNMPQAKVLKFTESIQYFAGTKTSRLVLEAGLDWFIPLIRQHKEMVSQIFGIKISIIRSGHKTLKRKLALANAIFRKMFGLTLKANHVYTGNPNIFEIKLMDCFTYDDGALMLKLPSGKLIKSYLNSPAPIDPAGLGHKDNPTTIPLDPAVPLVSVLPPDPANLPDTKPLAPMYYLPCVMDNIRHSTCNADDIDIVIWCTNGGGYVVTHFDGATHIFHNMVMNHRPGLMVNKRTAKK